MQVLACIKLNLENLTEGYLLTGKEGLVDTTGIIPASREVAERYHWKTRHGGESKWWDIPIWF